jgi:hypothetical protein
MMPNSASSVDADAAEKRNQRRLKRDDRAKERAEEDRLYKEENPSSNSDGEQGVLDPDPEEPEVEEEKKNKVAIKQMAKELSKELVLSDGKFSRSKLPKLDYTKMVMVNITTFPQWLKQIKVVAYTRRWPLSLTTIGDAVWDLKEDNSDESMARREAYQWMEQSVPKEEKYIIEFVEAGDAHGIYNNLWNRFYKTTPLTISSEVGKFWSLTQENVAVDVFAATVHSVAEKLVAAGKAISDQDKATVFIGGLAKAYSQLKEQYRSKTTFKFNATVADATEYASLHGLLNSKPSSSSSAGTLLNVTTVCKFHRMKKGCFNGDKCPLASSHTKETKGKGWKDGEVKAVAPPRIAKDNKVKGSFAAVKSNFKDAKKKCFCCGSLDHGIKDCTKKSEFAKFQASQQKGTTMAVNCNFVFMPHLMAVKPKPSTWMMDGGSSEHITPNDYMLKNLCTLAAPLVLLVGNGQTLVAKTSGTLMLNDVAINNVLFCKECPMNILSEGRLLELGCEISKSATMAVISRNGIAMLKATPAGRLMFINQAYCNSVAMCAKLSPA